jgi:hypothetical protein
VKLAVPRSPAVGIVEEMVKIMYLAVSQHLRLVGHIPDKGSVIPAGDV